MRRVCPERQRGVTLVAALLILLLTGFLAATAYENSTLQLRMAGNEQYRIQSRQGALAVVDALMMNPSNFYSTGPVGHKNCALGSTALSCDLAALVPAGLPQNIDSHSQYSIIRQPPLATALPRMRENSASSSSHYRAALFEIRALHQVSRRNAKGVSVAQGVMVKLPVNGQTTVIR